MFILRKVGSDNVEMNIMLGASYTYVTKEKNPNEFSKVWEKLMPKEECLYGYVTNDKGEIIWLSNYQYAYIMTESGQTFANISPYMIMAKSGFSFKGEVIKEAFEKNGKIYVKDKK